MAAGEFEVIFLLILIDILLISFLFGLLHIARRFGLENMDYMLYVVDFWTFPLYPVAVDLIVILVVWFEAVETLFLIHSVDVA